MSNDPLATGDVDRPVPSSASTRLRCELLTQLLESWLPVALRQSRRATLAQVLPGTGTAAAQATLRVITGHDRLLHRARLGVLILSPAEDLAVRLGAGEVGLPPDVSVLPVPGDVDRLPVALRAAGAAGAPLLVQLDRTGATAPDLALLTAVVAAGRPAEVLIIADPAAGTPAGHRRLLLDAGFPLVAVVELATPDGPGPRGSVIAFGTGSDRRLAACKEAIWRAAAVTGTTGRDAVGDPAGEWLLLNGTPDDAPLRRQLLARVVESGPSPVTELRRFVAEHTLYRVADTGPALEALIDTGQLIRTPDRGRLSGEVVISGPAPTTP
jgi:hypothetical protein